MKKNEGTADRLVRVVVGLIAAYGGFVTTGVLHWVLYVVAVLGLFTAATGFCAIYALLGISTAASTKHA